MGVEKKEKKKSCLEKLEIRLKTTFLAYLDN